MVWGGLWLTIYRRLTGAVRRLGSGKTTLVNAMMSMLAEQGHRVALIQNEFSEAGMDPTVTDADSGQVFDNLIELAKGYPRLLHSS